MGLQIPRGLHSQVPQKNDLWRIAPTSRRGVRQAGAAEREPDRGRSSSRGSRAYVDFDSTEICGLAGGWLHQSAVPDASNNASTNPRPSEARGEAGDRTGHACCSAIYGLIFSINMGGKGKAWRSSHRMMLQRRCVNMSLSPEKELDSLRAHQATGSNAATRKVPLPNSKLSKSPLKKWPRRSAQTGR